MPASADSPPQTPPASGRGFSDRPLDLLRDRAATQGRAADHFDVNGVAFDSREVGPGDLFVALKGETTDGHRFVDQAFAAGRGGSPGRREPIAQPHVRVADTTRRSNALGIASRARSAAR